MDTKRIIFVVTCLALFTAPAFAATIKNNLNNPGEVTLNGVNTTVHDLTLFPTYGNRMVEAGLQIKVEGYVGSTGNTFSQTVPWLNHPTDPTAGMATGTNWTLTERVDTFDNPWIFNVTGNNVHVTDITLIGFERSQLNDFTSPNQGVVFDIWDEFLYERVKGTPGSEFGQVFRLSPNRKYIEADGSRGATIPAQRGPFINNITPFFTLEYTDPLVVASSSVTGVPVGDLFRQAHIRISGDGLISGTQLVFDQDTDIAILRDPTAVPVPAALPAGLVLLGALGFRHLHRRRHVSNN